MIRSRNALVVYIGILLVGCAPQSKPPIAPIGGFPENFPTALYTSAPAESVYRVVPGRASLILKVYRTGTLAALGHNHVITTDAIDGFIYLADDLATARADLFVPVAALVVDDAAARLEAGPDFDTVPTLQAIQGTRANMLGEKLLDAEHFPFLLAHITPVHVGPESTEVMLALTVRGQAANKSIAVAWQRRDEELLVQASFSIDHATLSLEPFSAMGGALRVAQTIDVAVTLVARRAAIRSAGIAPDS